MNEELTTFKEKVRELVANYMYTEGCSCCRIEDKHEEDAKALAELLDVEQYSDCSGYNFEKYSTRKSDE